MSAYADAVNSAAELVELGMTPDNATSAVLVKLTTATVRVIARYAILDGLESVARQQSLQTERSASVKRIRRRHKVAVPAEVEDAIDSVYVEARRDAIAQYMSAIKMVWTAELLVTEFALGDGTKVTWGEATIEQHEIRLDIFTSNAHANLEGAARHAHAIDAIRMAGAARLDEVVAQ
jgi:hypothetical protein